MKKLLLAASLMCLLVCLFAITVSAAVVISENNIDADGDIVPDIIYKYTDKVDETHLTSVGMTYTSTDGEEKSGIIYYVISLWSQQNKRQIEIIYLPSDFDMSQTVYFPDKVDINGDGAYSYNEFIFGTRGSAFYIKTYTSFANNQFEGSVDVKETGVQAVSYSKYMTYFGPNAFSKCVALNSVTYNGRELEEYTCIISPQITNLMGGAFGGEGGSTNSHTSNFTRIVFEDREGTVSFDQYALTRGELVEIVFGSGTYALNGSNTLSHQYKTEYSSEFSLERIIVNKDTVIKNGEVSWNVGEYAVVFAGTEEEYNRLYDANGIARFKNMNSVSFDPCYFTGHSEEQDDGDCTTAVFCANGCGKVFKEPLSHTDGEAIFYESYLSKGEYRKGCTNIGCNNAEITVLEPLFVCYGYSCTIEAINGVYSMTQTFGMNHSAIEKYKEFYPDFEFGLVASSVSNPFAPENEELISGNKIVVSDGSDYQYDFCEMKIKGITADMLDKKIVFCVYAINGNEISYIDNSRILNEINGISYNEISALIK